VSCACGIFPALERSFSLRKFSC